MRACNLFICSSIRQLFHLGALALNPQRLPCLVSTVGSGLHILVKGDLVSSCATGLVQTVDLVHFPIRRHCRINNHSSCRSRAHLVGTRRYRSQKGIRLVVFDVAVGRRVYHERGGTARSGIRSVVHVGASGIWWYLHVSHAEGVSVDVVAPVSLGRLWSLIASPVASSSCSTVRQASFKYTR